MCLEDILKTVFNENESTVKCSYRKVINVKPYETETFEVEASVKLERSMDNAERMFIASILEAQAELSVFSNLLVKGMITKEEYVERKKKIEEYCRKVSELREKVK